MGESATGALEASSPSSPPSWPRPLTFFATGALAGASTVPIDFAWERLSTSKSIPLSSFIRSRAPVLIGRAGVRFLVFDQTKFLLQRYPSSTSIPVWVQGGVSGAVGGFAETCAHELMVNARLPTFDALSSQSRKLFMCFGTYTYLSTTCSPQQLPPKPFWYCWLMGAAAGGLGSGIISRLEGIKGAGLWTSAVPRGAMTIGTVIAVQVTSCAAVGV
ncbi:MAG: hypothetical protein M1827_003108 [Pycnora praestabilis]|nr:MAG: hypothetical protein M1827_003108 [Pycnora praestabilis]